MLFYKDIQEGIEKDYETLIDELKRLDSYCPYCYAKNYYLIFRNIIHSLLLGRELVLLDSDFSEAEIKALLGDADIDESVPVPGLADLALNNIDEKIKENSTTWKITLFTSGTTGLPKKISHTFLSLTRFLKRKNHETDVWGFAYNPTHIAGLQVFFQGFCNRNPIIRLFGLDKKTVFSLIGTYHITHISATPTFYRLLLPYAGQETSVRRITCGGEKFDSRTAGQLLAVFPNAKLTNVYASTEAGTLFASDGEVFVVKQESLPYLRIENGSLHLHKSLMGESDSVRLTGEWYDTGDLVEVVSEHPLKIRFLSRKNEMINVGGYKVNPTEVEQAIRGIAGVRDACVFAKSNRLMGNVICSEVALSDKSLTEQKIREYLKGYLQEYKIPRVIKFVDELTTTRTGKIARHQ